VTLTARWVFPVDGPPLPRGTVTVRGASIEAVEPAGRRTADLDFGNAAILPGLVNAHTHLDLSGLRGLAPPSLDFTAWLRQVVAFRRSRSPEQIQADVHAGLAECLRFGTTLVGDISSDGTSWQFLAEAPLRAVVYREWLGLTEERRRQAEDWTRYLETEHKPTETCRLGLSPHAPYSVHQATIAELCETRLPFCIHLGETAAELELLEHRRGPFVEFLTSLGAWNPKGLAPSPQWILEQTRRAAHPLYVHANYLSGETPSLSAGSVVYCPRTHAAFGHPPHPFREFLKAGVRVVLGTDSLASNPDLDILAEARYLKTRYPDLDGAVLLRMLTLSGAEALGWGRETGSLAPGKSADLVVLPTPNTEPADPHDLLFLSSVEIESMCSRGVWRGRGFS
jgi:cytosine/adenosine deaminase-related metal-dependent hydrolase